MDASQSGREEFKKKLLDRLAEQLEAGLINEELVDELAETIAQRMLINLAEVVKNKVCSDLADESGTYQTALREMLDEVREETQLTEEEKREVISKTLFKRPLLPKAPFDRFFKKSSKEEDLDDEWEDWNEDE
jgi:hypothetical protein